MSIADEVKHTIHPHTRRRETSSTSCLREALLHSEKLNIFTRTIATKILFDDSKKATGVLLNTDGFKWKISASKEVIISAGVVSINPLDTLLLFALADRSLDAVASAAHCFGHWSEGDLGATGYRSSCGPPRRRAEHVGE
jgi:choline dehydrogenase-like flavoprotein